LKAGAAFVLLLLVLVGLGPAALAQDDSGPAGSEQQRARALVGLTTQLNEALAEEARFNALTVQLQRFRAETMALTSRLKLREGVQPPTTLTATDLQAQALARFVEDDLALNVLAANEQLAPLDAVRVRVVKLNDAVETLRSALVMEGVETDTGLSLPSSAADAIAALPRPDGVFAERQPDFRPFPPQETAAQTRPLILPLAAGGSRVTRAFGAEDPDDPGKIFQKGAHLSATANATVRAPFEGKITYAAPYLSFDNLVVIEHEGGGATLLAGLHSFAISVGDWVGQGAPLGLMAPATAPPPTLYFEFRIDQVPVDPLAFVGSLTNE